MSVGASTGQVGSSAKKGREPRTQNLAHRSRKHHQVEENEGRRLDRRNVEAAEAIRSNAYRVAVLGEQPRDTRRDGGLVLNDQDVLRPDVLCHIQMFRPTRAVLRARSRA